MKHQYEDYIKFCDEKAKVLDEYIANFEAVSNPKSWNLYPEYVMKKQFRASLLANKATLERHKEVPPEYDDLDCNRCDVCYDEHGCEQPFPCLSLLDVTNQLDEVMG